jgi:predicted component of type VI protein secretion system
MRYTHSERQKIGLKIDTGLIDCFNLDRRFVNFTTILFPIKESTRKMPLKLNTSARVAPRASQEALTALHELLQELQEFCTKISKPESASLERLLERTRTLYRNAKYIDRFC